MAFLYLVSALDGSIIWVSVVLCGSSGAKSLRACMSITTGMNQFVVSNVTV